MWKKIRYNFPWTEFNYSSEIWLRKLNRKGSFHILFDEILDHNLADDYFIRVHFFYFMKRSSILLFQSEMFEKGSFSVWKFDWIEMWITYSFGLTYFCQSPEGDVKKIHQSKKSMTQLLFVRNMLYSYISLRLIGKLGERDYKTIEFQISNYHNRFWNGISIE